MRNKSFSGDEKAVAQLLRQMKVIATKEVERLPYHTLEPFLNEDKSIGCASRNSEEESSLLPSNPRSRTVSVDYVDNFGKASLETLPMAIPRTRRIISSSSLEHHDWSKVEGSRSRPRLSSPKVLITTKHGKRKAESFVGLKTKSGIVRATLRRKFSWKQYPELEGFLLANQEDYFEYSSRNYTAEQRKYNNKLTKSLLDLAATEGYIFEEFTFSMVRDRIRCYFKSYSQSAKKKRSK